MVKAFKKPAPKPAPIVIAYRDIQGKRMHGAFYDHYLFRKITQHDTLIAHSTEQTIDSLTSFIYGTIFALGIGDAIGERLIPALASPNLTQSGLLIIPGRAKNEKGASIRDLHESQLIKKAVNMGKPILAICGGVRPLCEHFGGSMLDVSDHTYSSMPYIVKNGGVGNNVQMHDIITNVDTLLSDATTGSLDDSYTVNSVHWEAPNEDTLPKTLVASSYSVLNKDITVNKRSGNQLEPEEDTVESIETKHGAPTMGVMWHPEAYFKRPPNENESKHLALIMYMTKAGDTFNAKQKVLQQLRETHSPCSPARSG